MVWVCIQSLSQLQYDFNQREANSTIKNINVLNIKNNLYFTKHTEKIQVSQGRSLMTAASAFTGQRTGSHKPETEVNNKLVLPKKKKSILYN